MNYAPGGQVWIPCDVKPGPFSDERMICVSSSRDEWVGFVHVSALREPILEGQTFVRAVILSIGSDGRFNAKIPGEPVTSSLFEGTLSRVKPLAAVQA